MSGCICPRGVRPLGNIDGVNMGRGTVRLSTTPGCPVHDSCQGYTAAHRAKAWQGSFLYCPIHRTLDCPKAAK